MEASFQAGFSDSTAVFIPTTESYTQEEASNTGLCRRMGGRIVSAVNNNRCYIAAGVGVAVGIAVIAATIYSLTDESSAPIGSSIDDRRARISCVGADNVCKKLGFLFKQGANYIASSASSTAECLFWRPGGKNMEPMMQSCSIPIRHGDTNLAHRNDDHSHLMAGTECHDFPFPSYPGNYNLLANAIDYCKSTLTKT
ncbi:hypothetical protein [Endozoicomonas sp.]|uniref:hypothetical protein n=1 Tax=Endozoicomonas sp. TaxID=1892382 RepID=UPI003AF8B150